MKKCDKIILFCLLVIYILSFVRYIDNVDYRLVDIFSHFPVQYALLAFFFLVICLWKKIIPLALLAGLLFAFNISVLVDSGSIAQAAGQEIKTFKVYSANINKSNTNYPKLVRGLMEADADILLLLEVTSKNIKPLQSLIHSYPYRVINLNTGSSGTGMVLISKFSILNHEVTKYSDFGNILVSVLLEVYDNKVAFYAVHFPRPVFTKGLHDRMEQFMSLARRIDGESVPVIVAGDFNATPYAPIFKQFLKRSGLKDSRTGYGWQPSWPVSVPPLWIPIDHILVSNDIQVHKRGTGTHIGSDHYPVIAELSI